MLDVIYRSIQNEIYGAIPKFNVHGIEAQVDVEPSENKLQKTTSQFRIINIHMVICEGPTTVFKILYTNGFRASISITGANSKAKEIVKTIESSLQKIKDRGETLSIITTYAEKIKKTLPADEKGKSMTDLNLPAEIKNNESLSLAREIFLLSKLQEDGFEETSRASYADEKDFILKHKKYHGDELDDIITGLIKKRANLVKQRYHVG